MYTGHTIKNTKQHQTHKYTPGMDNNTKKAQNNLREIQMYTRDTKYIIFKNHTHTHTRKNTHMHTKQDWRYVIITE